MVNRLMIDKNERFFPKLRTFHPRRNFTILHRSVAITVRIATREGEGEGEGGHDAFVIIVPGNCSGIIQFRSNFSLHPLKNPRPIRCR